MNEIAIRHYQTSDRDALLALAAETAFFGAPVEAFLEDRRLFCDAFARYYAENEAAFVWLADSPQGVIGFLLGCPDTSLHSKRWRRYLRNTILVNALSGKYRLGRRTAGFTWGMLMGAVRGEVPAVDLSRYPAHLQIDVKDGHRGSGIGRALIDAYLEQLNDLAVSGVHLETTSHNQAACHLYEKIGFRLLDARPNRFWTSKLAHPVDNRTYGLKLR
jgi:ribosomal protein S18 acetylase RimI-like enzyme